jgi:hypothetical protein
MSAWGVVQIILGDEIIFTFTAPWSWRHVPRAGSLLSCTSSSWPGASLGILVLGIQVSGLQRIGGVLASSIGASDGLSSDRCDGRAAVSLLRLAQALLHLFNPLL